MLTPPPRGNSKKADTDSPASAALKCAYALMQQRIISSPTDMMGILLYGTEHTKFRDGSGNGYAHCYFLADLDIPAAEDVKALKTLIEDEDDFNRLLKPAAETVSMANLLFYISQIFTTKASNFASRRLFIVTDNDNPNGANKASRSAAAVRAKDLYDLGVVIELFPVSKPGSGFDRSKFYDVRLCTLMAFHLLTDAGHHLQCLVNRPRSSCPYRWHDQTFFHRRRHYPPQLPPLLYQLQSRRQTCPLL